MPRSKGSKDKKPRAKRVHAGGMPKKKDKVKRRNYWLNDADEKIIVNKYGSGTEAIKSLLPGKLKK